MKMNNKNMIKTMEQTVTVNEVSRISPGTVIKGEITSPTDIRVDGSFEGKLISKGRIVVGEKAVVSGDIIGENVDFWGKMTGAIYAKDTLSLKAGCTIDGDLHIKRLEVELGACFDGNCKMVNDGEFDAASGKPQAEKKDKIGGTPIQA